ncbi:uncharacterized mitochondrial protein-like protein [Tanacetum coccineum]
MKVCLVRIPLIEHGRSLIRSSGRGTAAYSHSQSLAKKAQDFLPFHQRNRRMTDVLEYVLCGHRCPGRDEPYSNDAISLIRHKIMQRDVEIKVETVCRTGTFIGSLWESITNVGAILLEVGLAKLQTRFGADRIADAHLLQCQNLANKHFICEGCHRYIRKLVKLYIILNKQTMKVEESLNVTFDETPPPPKTSPLEDDELVEEEAIEEMLKKFRLEDSKPMKTPMSTETKLTRDEEGESVDNTKYRGMIEDPKTSHLEAVKRIFRYIKGTTHLGLWYPKGSGIETIVYADSDHAGDYVDRKSTSGVCTFMGCCLTSWFSKKQTALAISITEAEYVSAGKACQQALWMKQALVDLR